MSHTLSHKELHDLETTERVASCFSLIGTSFILFTFLYSPAFRKPVNRLIFYASWGFLPADALWNLAMAINVYMTLFRKYNAQQLKALEWRYHCMTPSKGKIYGPATLWCWINIEWVAFRIALCYAPAWCCILISLCIYVLAGREIFAKRNQLRAFSNPSRPVPVRIENPFTSFKTTEIHITSELATLHSPNASNMFVMPDKKNPDINDEGYNQYSVTIASAPMGPGSEARPPMTPRAQSTITQRNNRAAMEANKAAFGYTKVPSSINRVYSLIHPSLVSLSFTYASGIVLPLMGFWNSVIYITTSWAAVQLLFSGKLNENKGSVKRSCSISFNNRPSLGARKWTGAESDSVKGLALGYGSGHDQV
ncbi:MAG: hypothetical protein Q9175_002410 [Cornicularia normoerica]